MNIAGHSIGPGCPPFIVAEAGLNHCGNLDRAVQMIYVAKRAGCDAVKYQTYRTEEFCATDDPMFVTFKACELERKAWAVLKAECDRVGIVFLSTPQNRSDLDILLEVGIPAIKVGSDDFCNLPLLRDYASVGLPMILSCGMASSYDAGKAMLALIGVATPWPPAVMVCTSQYPCPPSEVNLLRTEWIKGYEISPPPIPGFSDHTTGNVAAAVAVGLGACIFEKHFKLGTDVPEKHAVLPEQLKEWVATIREAHTALGSGSFELTEREQESRRKWQRRPGQQIRGAA